MCRSGDVPKEAYVHFFTSLNLVDLSGPAVNIFSADTRKFKPLSPQDPKVTNHTSISINLLVRDIHTCIHTLHYIALHYIVNMLHNYCYYNQSFLVVLFFLL